MHTPNHKSAFTRAGIHILAGVALLGVSLGVWASSGSDVPSMSGHDNGRSMQQRGFFGEMGHYLAHNTYGSLGYLRFEYIGSSNALHIHGTARQLLGAHVVRGSGTSQSNQGTVGATIGVFLPKTHHHLSVEFGLAPPIKFDYQLTGTGQEIGGGTPSPQNQAAAILGGALGKKLGTFKSLPPNFTLVLRPFTHTVIQPYVGAGAMWLHTYDRKITNPHFHTAALALNATPAKFDLSQPWACVFQAGFDIELPKPLFFKFDAKYVGCATVNGKIDLGNSLKYGNLGKITTKNNFQAMLYQASFGINF